MSDGMESTPPTPAEESRGAAKRTYEKPAVIWIENLNLGASQPFCQKISGAGADCTASPGS